MTNLITGGPARLMAATTAAVTALACLAALAAAPAAMAQQASSANQETAGVGLEEIVVTAERRDEQLQTTPISISAFSAQDMESRSLVNISDVGAYVPSTVLAPLGAG
jgi:iron complex outermembrane recepter protein